MLNGLDLFTGIGGLTIALNEWVRPLAYCEIDPYCQGILLSRMANGDISKAPICDNIKSLHAIPPFSMFVDIIYGGFPCQGISVAGLGKGLADERSGLFFEIMRLAKEIMPKFIFLENVPAITTRGGLQVVREIAEMGYDCRWCIIPANEFIDQKRERWFLLAKSRSLRCTQRTRQSIQSTRKASLNEESSNYKLSNMESWATFANSVREINGISSKMDRIRALGNSVCPQQAKKAFKVLMGLK